MKYNIHAIVPMVGLAINTILTVILYMHRRNPVVRKFFYFTFGASFWFIQMIGFHLAPSEGFVRIWSMVFLNGMIIIPMTMLDFCFEFTGYNRTKIWIRNALWVVTFAFVVANSTDNFASRFTYFNNIKYVLIGTLWYKAFIIYFAAVILILLPVTFYHGYRRVNSHQVQQKYRYMILALFISLPVASTNFLSNLGIPMYPLGALSSIPLTALVTYAIIKHELLDIRIIIRKTMVFTALTVFISLAYALVLGGSYLLFRNIIPQHTSYIAGLISILIITFLFQPVRDRVQRTLERLFYREKYDYQYTLSKISRDLDQYVEPDRLFVMVAERILQVMKIKHLSLYLLDKDSGAYPCLNTHYFENPLALESARNSQKSYSPDCSLVQALLAKRTCLRDEEALRHTGCSGLECTLVIPLRFKDELSGFFTLGDKLSDQPFFTDDIDLLQTVANQTAVVLRNISLFQEIQRVHRVMYQQDKMAALGALAFGIAHEIKNPLTPIKSFTQKMMNKPGNTAREDEMGTKVLSEFSRLDAMLSNLLTYGKTSAVKMIPTDVNTVIDETLLLCGAELRKNNIRIVTRFNSTIPLVKADKNQLVQLFLNLTGNAMDAMPGGGTLKAATGTEGFGSSTQVVVSFTDTGKGIPADQHEKIFALLYTTKPNGTGLGLAISKKIVIEHHGRIRLESRPGQGTSFYIYLPAPGI